MFNSSLRFPFPSFFSCSLSFFLESYFLGREKTRLGKIIMHFSHNLFTSLVTSESLILEVQPCLSVCRAVCHNFLKGRKVTNQCSYRSTCYLFISATAFDFGVVQFVANRKARHKQFNNNMIIY